MDKGQQLHISFISLFRNSSFSWKDCQILLWLVIYHPRPVVKWITKGRAARTSDDNKVTMYRKNALHKAPSSHSSHKELRHTANFFSLSSPVFLSVGIRLDPEPCLLDHASPPPTCPHPMHLPTTLPPPSLLWWGRQKIIVTAPTGKPRGPCKVHCENERACSLITFRIRSATCCQIKTWPTTHFSCSHSYKLVH